MYGLYGNEYIMQFTNDMCRFTLVSSYEFVHRNYNFALSSVPQEHCSYMHGIYAVFNPISHFYYNSGKSSILLYVYLDFFDKMQIQYVKILILL